MTLASEEGRFDTTPPVAADAAANTAASKPSAIPTQRMTQAAWTALAAVYFVWGSTYLVSRAGNPLHIFGE